MFKLNVRSSAKLSALTLALTLAGCASGPHLAEKSLAQSAFFAGQNYADELNESGASNQWWQSYQSPQLDALVKQGLESNRNLQAAQQRLQAAMQQLGYEEAQHLPQGGLQVESSRESAANSIDASANAGANFSWQFDLFGRIAALIKAAEANSFQAQEQKTQLAAEVVSGVTRSFFEWQGNQLKLQIVNQQIAALTESISVLQARVDEGFASKLDINRTYAQLNQQKTLLPQIETALYRNQATLAVLLGQTPSQVQLSFETDLLNNNLIQPVTLNQPEKAVSLRPEISIARYKLLQQSALADAADAALYPDISISGFVGLINPIGNNLSKNDDGWSLTPQLNWSILSWPALKAQAKAQSSLTQAAFLDYENTIISVIAESQTALVNMKQSKNLHEFANQRLLHAEAAHLQAKAMYEEGQMPYLDLLSARQDALVAKQASVDAKVAFMLAKISTYKAFSGGWSRTLVQ
ncbi:MAG: TolC family protein [Paraglaciecola chathamensis]|jgi:multidrug efflux system outer membrane protein|uniref:TolC family protein n=1 Tax=Neptuniibacter pectenicola TaxID=1806669 RepID=UPI0008359CFA|nr:TolC family protein [Neptuniibacter pectenicola]|tara:strand:+ start:6793 stop:8196 length:1404 start_codon:yes stop_codon:yes gene_type:complete